MDICQEIENGERCFAELSAEYAATAIFGNETDQKLFDLVRLNCYIEALERNVPRHRKVKLLVTGSSVPFSSLRRQNNTLILDTIPSECVTSEIEVRQCLSDSEICKIVELIQVMCYGCQSCN